MVKKLEEGEKRKTKIEILTIRRDKGRTRGTERTISEQKECKEEKKEKE